MVTPIPNNLLLSRHMSEGPGIRHGPGEVRWSVILLQLAKQISQHKRTHVAMICSRTEKKPIHAP